MIAPSLHDDRADRHLAARAGRARERERLAHPVRVIGRRAVFDMEACRKWWISGVNRMPVEPSSTTPQNIA